MAENKNKSENLSVNFFLSAYFNKDNDLAHTLRF